MVALFNSNNMQNVWVGGTIVNVDDTTSFRTIDREIMCWPENGEPIDQLIIDVETDDGTIIRFFIRHENVYNFDGTIRNGTKYRELMCALDKAKLINQLPREGDLLFMRWTSTTDQYTSSGKKVPRKIWEVRYEKVDNND